MQTMRARVSVLFGIFCSAVLITGPPANSSDSDRAKSVIDATQPPLSIGSKEREDTGGGPDQPIPKASNVDPVEQDQDAVSGRDVVDQTSSPASVDVGGAKGEGDSVAPGVQDGNDGAKGTVDLTESTCSILKTSAATNGLPLEFFARVIWEESRFKPRAIGPTTRTGHRAQGIAQFMPYTATARGLDDPFNPDLALPEAAEFLAELRSEFGNLGLAAAAYNAGPGRVRDFLEGRGGMPAQTRHYVRAITGREIEEWAVPGHEAKDGVAKSTSCRQLAALLTERPAFSVGKVKRTARDIVKPARGAKVRRSSARLSRSATSTRSKRRRVRSRVRTGALDKVFKASEEQFNRIKQICRGCLQASRLKSGKSSARLSRAKVSTRSKRKSVKRRLRTLARGRAVKASENKLKKIMQICRGC
jgi:hypothetical protein